MAKLLIDPLVRIEANEVISYYRSKEGDEFAERLSLALQALTYVIGKNPEGGLPISGLPLSYRRKRTGKHFPPYVFSYRYDREKDEVLVYLLRHAAQRPYAPSTLRRKANEAQHRVEES